jgi:TP901 family phage tail tape measure protein
MALNNIGLGIVFTASDLASNVIRQVTANFLGLSNTVTGVSAKLAQRLNVATATMTTALQGFSKGLAVATAGALALGAAFNLADEAGKFEYQMAAVGAVTRATTGQLQRLDEAAIQAGLSTQFSPTEAARGLQTLATAGQSAEQAMQTLVPVLDLATGSMGEIGIEGAAAAVVGTLNAYNLEASKAGEVTDKLLKVTLETNLQARDFEAALAKSTATAKIYGQTLDDTLITVGLLRNRNIDASSSATSFREALRHLGADQRAQKAIESANVKIFEDGTRRMRSMVDITLDFVDATRNWTDEQRQLTVEQAFGARGLLAYNAISLATAQTMKDGKEVTVTGREAIALLRKEMQNAGGTAEYFRQKMLDTFEGQKQLVSAATGALTVEIGRPFAQVFKPLVALVHSALVGIVVLIRALPSGVKTAFASFFVAGAAATILAGLIAAGVALLPVLKAIGVAMLAAFLPAIKIVAVVALLVLAAYAMKKAWEANFGGIRDFVVPIVEKIKLVVMSLYELFSNGEIVGPLAGQLTAAGNEGAFGFVDAVSRAVAVLRAIWQGMFSAIQYGWNEVSDAFRPVGSELLNAFSELYQAAIDVVKPILAIFGIKAPDADAIGFIRGLAKFMTMLVVIPVSEFLKAVAFGLRLLIAVVRAFAWTVSTVVGVGTKVWDFFSGVFGKIGDFFSAIDRGVSDTIYGVINSMTRKFSGAFGMLRSLWSAFVGVLFAPWNPLGTLISSIWSGIKSAIVSAINILIGQINMLISAAATVARVLHPGPLGTYLAGQISSMAITPLATSGSTPGPSPAPASSPGAPQTPSSPGGAGRLIPPSAPMPAAPPPQAPAATRDDIRFMADALNSMTNERGGARPLQGDVIMDGTRVGRVQQRNQREQEARDGRVAPSRR